MEPTTPSSTSVTTLPLRVVDLFPLIRFHCSTVHVKEIAVNYVISVFNQNFETIIKIKTNKLFQAVKIRMET